MIVNKWSGRGLRPYSNGICDKMIMQRSERRRIERRRNDWRRNERDEMIGDKMIGHRCH